LCEESPTEKRFSTLPKKKRKELFADNGAPRSEKRSSTRSHYARGKGLWSPWGGEKRAAGFHDQKAAAAAGGKGESQGRGGEESFSEGGHATRVFVPILKERGGSADSEQQSSLFNKGKEKEGYRIIAMRTKKEGR